MRFRRHIRAVGFQQNPLHRDFFDRADKLLCIFKRHNATDTDVIAHLDEFMRHLRRVGITVDHSRIIQTLLMKFLQNIHRIFRRIPRMDNNRKLFLAGKLQLAPKPVALLLLHIRFLVPIIIQSDLTDRNRLLVLRLLRKPCEGFLIQSVNITRMHTDCCIDEIMTLGDL